MLSRATRVILHTLSELAHGFIDATQGSTILDRAEVDPGQDFTRSDTFVGDFPGVVRIRWMGDCCSAGCIEPPSLGARCSVMMGLAL
jgi:hypothetical protein